MTKLNFKFLALLFAFPVSSICQPTITNAFNPVDGTVFKLATADTTGINVGPAGANMVYDFSKLKMVGSEGTYKYQTAASTPYASHFTSANLAFYSTTTGGSTGYTYIKTTPNDYHMIGIGLPTTKMVYTDPQLTFKYPVTMGSKASDKFMGSSPQVDYTTYRYGTLDYVADGYGTLKLPGITINNVLRVKLVQNFIDSMDIDGDYILTPYIVTTYNYVSNDYKQQLLGISTILTEDLFGDPVITKTVTYYPGSAGVEKFSKQGFTMYPNPASGFLTLELPGMDIQSLTTELTNITGKVINTSTVYDGNNKITLNTLNLPDGIYFIHLNKDGNRFESQKVLVSH